MFCYKSDAAKVLYFENYLTKSSHLNFDTKLFYVSISQYPIIRNDFLIFFRDELKSFIFPISILYKLFYNDNPIEYHLKLLNIIKCNSFNQEDIKLDLIINCVAKIFRTRYNKIKIDESILWQIVDQLLISLLQICQLGFENYNIFRNYPNKFETTMNMIPDLDLELLTTQSLKNPTEGEKDDVTEEEEPDLRQKCCYKILNIIRHNFKISTWYNMNNYKIFHEKNASAVFLPLFISSLPMEGGKNDVLLSVSQEKTV